MARKVDEAASFVFVQLIEQVLGIYDRRHPDYDRQVKIDLAWERILSLVQGVWILVRFFRNNISMYVGGQPAGPVSLEEVV
jgi:hypothetical protein